jgi:hypothetical protein
LKLAFAKRLKTAIFIANYLYTTMNRLISDYFTGISTIVALFIVNELNDMKVIDNNVISKKISEITQSLLF